jgi:hypothetical protein
MWLRKCGVKTILATLERVSLTTPSATCPSQNLFTCCEQKHHSLFTDLEETAVLTMSLLSERQQEELCVSWLAIVASHYHAIIIYRFSHKSMLEYLHSHNFTEAYNALKKDTGTEYTPDPKTKYAGLLEKKWTSVIRLQKKVRLVLYASAYIAE